MRKKDTVGDPYGGGSKERETGQVGPGQALIPVETRSVQNQAVVPVEPTRAVTKVELRAGLIYNNHDCNPYALSPYEGQCKTNYYQQVEQPDQPDPASFQKIEDKDTINPNQVQLFDQTNHQIAQALTPQTFDPNSVLSLERPKDKALRERGSIKKERELRKPDRERRGRQR